MSSSTFFSTDTITITRRVQTGLAYASTTIYSGPGDYQESTGALFYDPRGPVDSSEALVFIDPDGNGNFPQTFVGDVVQVTQNVNGVPTPVPDPTGQPALFEILSQMLYTIGAPHLELRIKRGPLSYQGAPK